MGRRSMAVKIDIAAQPTNALVWDQPPDKSGIKLTSGSILKMPPRARHVPPAKDDRRTAQERIEAQERAEAVAVALAQPHRRGSDNPKAGEPLHEFCALYGLRRECYDAGIRYAEIVGEAKTAQGFSVPGWTPGDSGYEQRTPEQIEARKELALIKLRNAEGVLRIVQCRPTAMERLTFDQREPAQHDHDALRNGLWRLAVDFGLLKLGMNAEKNI